MTNGIDPLKSVADAQFRRLEQTIAALERETLHEGSARAVILRALRDKREELLRTWGPFA